MRESPAQPSDAPSLVRLQVDLRYPNAARPGELPGDELRDVVLWERNGGRALAAEYHAPRAKIEVEVVESMLPAVVWGVAAVIEGNV